MSATFLSHAVCVGQRHQGMGNVRARRRVLLASRVVGGVKWRNYVWDAAVTCGFCAASAETASFSVPLENRSHACTNNALRC